MTTQRQSRLFDNRGLYAVFVYYFASLINDAVVSIHGISGLFTPRQFAVVLGIIFLAIPGRVPPSRLYTRSTFFLALFLYVSVLSYLATEFLGNANRQYIVVLFSAGLNIVWLIVVGRVLSQGLSDRDKVRLPWNFVILGLIPLLTGLYEIAQGEHILRGTDLTARLVGNLFWVRGLHLDKVSYTTALAPAVIAAFLLIPRTTFSKKLFLLVYFGASLVCLFQSFSVTGILGIAGGLSLLFVLHGTFRVKVVTSFVFVLATIIVLISLASERGEVLSEWYTAKFERQRDLDQNPRYVIGAICVREFLRSPVWGLGAGRHIPLVYQEVEGQKSVGGGNAHSIISVPADLGIIGTVPFLLFWMILYATVFRPIPRMVRREIAPPDRVLRGLCVGLAVFVAARLLLYFHSMADEAFILWPALVFAVYPTLERGATRIPAELGSGRPPQTRQG